MTTGELRETYTAALSTAVLADPSAFYTAFDEGETGVADWLTQLWEKLCDHAGTSLEAFPFFPETDFWILDETDEDFACMMVSELPPLTQTPDASLVGVVFGAAMDPRAFSGVRRGKTVVLSEWQAGKNGAQPVEQESFSDDGSRRQTFADRIYAICDSYAAG